MIQEYEWAIWTIFFLPLGSFLVISLIVRPFFKSVPEQSSLITILAIGGSLGLSIWALQSVISEGAVPVGFGSHEWIAVGGLTISLGLIVDELTAIMLVVATGISLMVQIYSVGYMRGDPSYPRYFAIMSLFTASMVGLVLASNIIQLYVFWELVGVCSYLLIGFWFERPAAAAAAKKAFIVTRIGDFGFLIAILYLFFNQDAFTNTLVAASPDVMEAARFGLEDFSVLNIAHLNFFAKHAKELFLVGIIGQGVLTWLAVGIFAGAVGKSAQFPLHVWLPDAMEGPTPVSALIHAATMVAAGVFLVARFFPVFEASTGAMSMVAIVGAFTALFAATMGLVANDIKRVMAYSTVSQLGYMMAALGIGAYEAAIFHLFNHAFFKALLFMGAGSVNHAAGTFDMRYMGGLRRAMPWTYVTMVIGALSLAGIFPLAGFWSKDEILLHVWPPGDGGMVDGFVFWLLAVGVFLTALYAFRMIYMTFHGDFRGGIEAEREERGETAPAGGAHGVHLAESPLTMIAPMVLLSVAAVVSGYLANPLGFADGFLGIDPHWLATFLNPDFHSVYSFPLAGISVGVAAGGILVATAIYLWPKLSLGVVGRPFRGVHQLLVQKYYMDHLYEGQIVYRGVYQGIGATLDWFDRKIVDNVAELAGWFPRNTGRAISTLQTGQVQGYAVGISVGIAIIVVVFVIWRPELVNLG